MNNKIYISVISHNHLPIIKKLNCLPELAKNFNVVIQSNVFEKNIDIYCSQNNIYHIPHGNKCKGFGENNNDVYSFCKKKLKMKENDIFLVLNPDVLIEAKKILLLVEEMKKNKISFATINLFLDKDNLVFDNSIRNFPSLLDFISGFLGLRNKTILEKEKITTIKEIDWAAGSFLAFEASKYELVNGFDKKYFMYCEDIDICMRLKKKNISLYYIPYITGTHFAQHNNKKIFSKHFIWHVKSVFKYLKSKNEK